MVRVVVVVVAVVVRESTQKIDKVGYLSIGVNGPFRVVGVPPDSIRE